MSGRLCAVTLAEGYFLRPKLYITSQDDVCSQLKAKYLDVPYVASGATGSSIVTLSPPFGELFA
jgi:hypothetical protein